MILELKKEFDDISFQHLPQKENQITNALAILSTIFKVNRESDIVPIQMSIYSTLAHCQNVEKKNDYWPWYHGNLQYIKNQ